MAEKEWSPRRLEGWIEASLREAIDSIRTGADFDGPHGQWDAHLEATPWSEMNWEQVVWSGGEIDVLLAQAEEFDLRISPALVERAKSYQVNF